jgi:fluoride exporter
VRNVLSVAIGGGLGAVLRYWAQLQLSERFATLFPWGTFTVNVSGAFLIGLYMTLLSKYPALADWRLFVVVGLLGGFTTFSTLAWDVFAVAKQGSLSLSALYLGSSLAAGFVALFLGIWIGRLL